MGKESSQPQRGPRIWTVPVFAFLGIASIALISLTFVSKLKEAFGGTNYSLPTISVLILRFGAFVQDYWFLSVPLILLTVLLLCHPKLRNNPWILVTLLLGFVMFALGVVGIYQALTHFIEGV